MRKLTVFLFLMIVCLFFSSNSYATIFTVDANLHSITPSYVGAGTPSYYAAPLNTDLLLNPGDLLEISASGIWSYAPLSYDLILGPDGEINYPMPSPYIGEGLPAWSLVGKIDNGDYFFIGSNYSETVSDRGILYLGFNDTDYNNNWGAVIADVSIGTVPEPSTILLFGIGLVGSFFRRKIA